MSLIGFLSIACTPPLQTVSRVTQTTSRHLPDTLQTLRGSWDKKNHLIKMIPI